MRKSTPKVIAKAVAKELKPKSVPEYKPSVYFSGKEAKQFANTKPGSTVNLNIKAKVESIGLGQRIDPITGKKSTNHSASIEIQSMRQQKGQKK